MRRSTRFASAVASLLVGLLAVPVAAQSFGSYAQAPDWRGYGYRPKANLNPDTIFQLLPAGGGQSSVVDLCSNVTKDGTPDIPAQGHVLDADTMFLLRLDETGTNYDADQIAGTTYGPATWSRGNGDVSGVAGLIRGARTFNGTNPGGNYFSSVSFTAAGITAMQGAVTYEGWVYWTGSIGLVWVQAADHNSELEADNVLMQVLILGTGKLRAAWEYGLGSDTVSAQVAGTTVPVNTWTHIAIARSVEGGGTCGLSFYIDGALQDTATGLTCPTGGGNTLSYLGRNGPLGDNVYFGGKMDDTRISKIARSSSEVLASYTRGIPVAASSQVLVGDYFCLRGDGTQASSTARQLSAVGSPTTQSQVLCPSGANCTTVSTQRIDGDSAIYYQTPLATPPLGDASWCFLGSTDVATGDNGDFISIGTSADNAANTGLIFRFNGTSLDWFFSDGSSMPSLATGATGFQAATRHLLCLTYDYVANGNSVMKLYVDGAVKATTSTVVGPMNTQSARTRIGFRATGTATSGIKGLIGNALFTEKVLDATTIQQLADASLGKLSGSAGEAVTFTRASGWGCASSDESSWSPTPINRSCVRKGGDVARTATTNGILQSESLDNVLWPRDGSGAAAPSITANTTDLAAPDGTFTAEKYSYPAVNTAPDYSRTLQIFVGSAVPYSASIWLRSPSSSTIYLYLGVAGQYHVQACAVTTTWSRCKIENKTLTVSAGWVFALGVELTVVAGNTMVAQPAQTVYAWGAHLNLGPAATDYCGPTVASTVACSAEVSTVSSSTWPVSAPGYVSFNYRPTGAIAAAQQFMVDSRTGNTGWAITRETSGVVNCLIGDGTAYSTITSAALTWVAGQSYNMKLRWNANGVECFRDGVSLGTATARIPNGYLAATHIGDYLGSTNAADGIISDFQLVRE